ncbi:hypothetical protein ACFPJ4_14555 [Lysinimonas soli]|uniref:Protein tyrosine phosphatase n=1 Tax=Lysinimonas soli TaxID=1074233 RepID=A0ABW0NW03_9MICO
MSIIATTIGTKVAIAALSLAALGGGTAAAAAAGVLPTPAQEFAHQTVGAPSPTASETPDATETPDPTSSASPKGPDATGPAAFGLCTAFSAGGLSTKSIAYGALDAAAPGGDITAYCATVLSTAPGHSAGHAPTSHPIPSSVHTGAPVAPHSDSSSHGAADSHGH